MASAVTIARTEVMRVSNAAHDKCYAENRDILKGEEYLATLDERCCFTCSHYDGTVFVYEPTGGETSYADRPILPMHPRRSGSLRPGGESDRNQPSAFAAGSEA